MTRNERPDAGLYDEDFYRWTQHQTAALRALPQNVVQKSGQIDAVHLAEEIEDLGKRDLREVMSNLDLVIQHLVELQAAPAARDAAHWHAEAVNFQRAARRAFSPSMRRLIDVEEAWVGGCRAAARFLQDAGAAAPHPGPARSAWTTCSPPTSTWRRRSGGSGRERFVSYNEQPRDGVRMTRKRRTLRVGKPIARAALF